MKNILIFRTAKFDILDKLFTELTCQGKDKFKIYVIVQEEMYLEAKNRYSYAEFFLIKNGFFTFKNYCNDFKLQNAINKNKYDYIYIPISTNNLKSCEEIVKIAKKISSKNIYIFKRDGSKHKVGRFEGSNIKQQIDDVCFIIKNIGLLIIYKIILIICKLCSMIKRSRND